MPVEELVALLSAAARVPLTVATVVAATAEIPQLVRHAHELLDLAQRLGRAPGVYRFAELAAHYQLTRPGSTRDQLAGQLAALDDHPDLLETLRVHLTTDGQRKATAKQLNVHPNTVDYRLRRIGEVTGLDPGDPTSLWYLRSAMIVREATPASARTCRCGAAENGGRRAAEAVSSPSGADDDPRP
nr:helix-turn-helix domain-containing protein [Nocardia bovistercoris]